MKFKHVLAVMVAVALSSSVAFAKDWTTVRIGTEGAYPPFNLIDSNGELQGFDIDIAKALCDEMKVTCTFVAQDWDGIIPALLANKYDAIVASMSITDERMEKVDFSDKYYNTPARFITNKDGGATDTTPAGMSGKTIGAQSSTTHATYLEDMYPDTSIKLYATQDEANLDLASGRLDAVLADSIVLLEWLKTDGGNCCEFVGEDVISVKHFGEGVGVALRQDDDDLREMLNSAIAAIRANGTYERINDKYFPFSIY